MKKVCNASIDTKKKILSFRVQIVDFFQSLLPLVYLLKYSEM